MKMDIKRVKNVGKKLICIGTGIIVLGVTLTYVFGVNNESEIEPQNTKISYYMTDEWAEIQKEMEKDIIPIYDIALGEDLQRYTYERCKERGIDYNFCLATMYVETGGTFDPNLRSASKDTGLMQINDCHKKWIKEAGYTDLYDPYQNIEVGCIILGEHVAKYGNGHGASMAYNMGTGTKRKLNKKGIYSSKYSRKVMKIKEEIFNK